MKSFTFIVLILFATAFAQNANEVKISLGSIKYGGLYNSIELFKNQFNTPRKNTLFFYFSSSNYESVAYFSDLELTDWHIKTLKKSIIALNKARFTSRRTETKIDGGEITFTVVTEKSFKCLQIFVTDRYVIETALGCGDINDAYKLLAFWEKARLELFKTKPI